MSKYGGLLETTRRKKILMAVDGSDQALEAVRYIGTTVLPEQTDIVLFNVGIGFPAVFWEFNRNPLYESKKSEVMGWLADYQLRIGQFKEKAFAVLAEYGFNPSRIQVKTQVKKTGVLKDIIQESYQGYSAIAVGRTGISRLKDMVLGSMAIKLAEKVKHIPTVIVGGKPVSRRILIALDESFEAMRGVSAVGTLAGGSKAQVTICHCLTSAPHQRNDKQVHNKAGDEDWLIYHKIRFKPYMDEAAQRLVEACIGPGQITQDFVLVKGNPIYKIIETARKGNFGTIVVGRRQVISFAQQHFRGRASEKIIKTLDNMAVWVVN